jgi:hypothetical protein
MSSEIEVFGIQSKNVAFQSDYIPLISFKSKQQKYAAENYITQEANYFLKNILNISLPAKPLAYHKLITDKDFQQVNIKYFYENLFNDLGERNSDGKIELKIKWSITFDEECAPIQVESCHSKFNASRQHTRSRYTDKKRCSYRRYGTIDINGTPIFYYIHFTIQEIIDVIKKIPISQS